MNREIIERKLASLKGYISELEPHMVGASSEIISSKDTIRIIERVYQLVVDTAIDCNQLIIEERKAVVPDTYQSTFYLLAELGVLKPPFAHAIAPSVGLRNRLVHRYEDIQLAVMISSIKKLLPLYHEYLETIIRYCAK